MNVFCCFKAFLRPVKDRPNLHIMLNTTATRILINQTKKVAYGVEVFRNGRLEQILAKNEVIVCAGAVNSPQLLLLSGVGPEAELRRHGIPVCN